MWGFDFEFYKRIPKWILVVAYAFTLGMFATMITGIPAMGAICFISTFVAAGIIEWVKKLMVHKSNWWFNILMVAVTSFYLDVVFFAVSYSRQDMYVTVIFAWFFVVGIPLILTVAIGTDWYLYRQKQKQVVDS